MKSVYFYETLIGKIGIADNESAITEVFMWADKVDYILQGRESVPIRETNLIKETARQLNEYFRGYRTSFDVPIELEGTEFQKSVWNALLSIPYGETRSYGEIAKHINNPKASRAVGGANHRNKIMILVPCHRVIGADQSLTGYAGGLDIKERLLKLEGSI